MKKDNTVGSRSETDLAYIAGFLDGDGSLMIQIKKRVGDKTKGRSRFMLTICFYQDSRHEKPLHWIRSVLKIGYLSRRRDGMSELRINGYKQIRNILEQLLPYLKFKKIQAKAILEVAKLLSSLKRDDKIIRKIIDKILIVQGENYVTKRKRTREELLSVFGLTP